MGTSQSSHRGVEEKKKRKKKAKDLEQQPQKQKSHPKKHGSDRNLGEEKYSHSGTSTIDVASQINHKHQSDRNSEKKESTQNPGVIARNDSKSNGKRKKRRMSSENSLISNATLDTVSREKKKRTGSMKSEIVVMENSEPNHEISPSADKKKINARSEQDLLKASSKENAAALTTKKEKSRKKRRKNRKSTKNVSLENKKESSGLEKHEVNDSSEAIETTDEKKTDTCSKVESLIRETGLGEQELASSFSKDEKSKKKRKKKRKSSKSVSLENEESVGSEKHEMNDPSKTVETTDEKMTDTSSKVESLTQKKTGIGGKELASSSSKDEKSKKKGKKKRKSSKNVSLEDEKKSSGLEKHEMNDPSEAIETTGKKKADTRSKSESLIQKESGLGDKELTSSSSKDEKRKTKGKKKTKSISLENEESIGSEKNEMNDHSKAIESTDEKETDTCSTVESLIHKKADLGDKQGADFSSKDEKGQKKGPKKSESTENISLANDKESGRSEKHRMNGSLEAIENTNEKKMDTCSKVESLIQKKTDLGVEEAVDFSSKDEKSRKKGQKKRKSNENISLENEKESSVIEKNETNHSSQAVETTDEKETGSSSKVESLIQKQTDRGNKEVVSLSSKDEKEYQLSGRSVCAEKKLLVLDLNGLLVDVVAGPTHSYKAHIKVSRKSVFKRPFCDEFIDFCFEKFNVGIWSSRTKHNLDQMVDFLFGGKRSMLLFCWDQEQCTQTGFKTRENWQKPLVLKELSRLWNSSDVPWKPGHFPPSNTLLIDDSPYKALCNPPNTSIFPKAYSYMNPDDNSLGPEGDLRVYLEGLAGAEDVQDYISQKPFGQPPILPDCPSWGFYSKVIEKMNSRFPIPAASASSLSITEENC